MKIHKYRSTRQSGLSKESLSHSEQVSGKISGINMCQREREREREREIERGAVLKHHPWSVYALPVGLLSMESGVVPQVSESLRLYR